jgi:hypothetical protein
MGDGLVQLRKAQWLIGLADVEVDMDMISLIPSSRNDRLHLNLECKLTHARNLYLAAAFDRSLMF